MTDYDRTEIPAGYDRARDHTDCVVLSAASAGS
jgi:hypothetical protein